MLKSIIQGIIEAAIGSVARLWKDNSARQRRRLELQGLLDDPKWRFRNTKVLSRSVGLPEAETADILLEIGARASTISDHWTLKPRR